ncbi:hypothetical protein [Mycolicibacterium sp. XJ1819]
MTENFDVAARLAAGGPGVRDVQALVLACQMLGYQHPDLTAHPAQVPDWYTAEDGLDLQTLDADCAALSTAVAAVEDALTRQDAQLNSLAGAWQGGGAVVSQEFLSRHGEASALAAAGVRDAARVLTELRDGLWQTVDGKVAAAHGIDERIEGQRGPWLAAAHTLATGTGDRAVASELIDQEVKPFVDTAIGGEWVEAMRSAIAAIETAYDDAVAELSGATDATFDVPGDLGPRWIPADSDSVATTPNAASGTPASPGVPGTPMTPAGWAPPPPAPVSAPASAPAAPVEPAAATAPPPAPALGGMPDIGSGLSGFAQQLDDMLGGLFGSTDDALADLPEVSEVSAVDEPLDLEETPEPDEPDSDDEIGDEITDEESPDEAPDDESATDQPDEEADASCEPAPEEAPPPVPVAAQPPVEPPPPVSSPEPASTAGTPCEIAAEELPQVGE